MFLAKVQLSGRFPPRLTLDSYIASHSAQWQMIHTDHTWTFRSDKSKMMASHSQPFELLGFLDQTRVRSERKGILCQAGLPFIFRPTLNLQSLEPILSVSRLTTGVFRVALHPIHVGYNVSHPVFPQSTQRRKSPTVHHNLQLLPNIS